MLLSGFVESILLVFLESGSRWGFAKKLPCAKVGSCRRSGQHALALLKSAADQRVQLDPTSHGDGVSGMAHSFVSGAINVSGAGSP